MPFEVDGLSVVEVFFLQKKTTLHTSFINSLAPSASRLIQETDPGSVSTTCVFTRLVVWLSGRLGEALARPPGGTAGSTLTSPGLFPKASDTDSAVVLVMKRELGRGGSNKARHPWLREGGEEGGDGIR